MEKIKPGDIVIRKTVTPDNTHLHFKVLHISGIIVSLRNVSTGKVMGVGHYVSEYRKVTQAEQILYGKVQV